MEIRIDGTMVEVPKEFESYSLSDLKKIYNGFGFSWNTVPEKGEHYKYIDTDGSIETDQWGTHNASLPLYANGNCFTGDSYGDYSGNFMEELSDDISLHRFLHLFATSEWDLATHEDVVSDKDLYWVSFTDDGYYTVECSSTTYPIDCVLFKTEEVAESAIDKVVKPFLKSRGVVTK